MHWLELTQNPLAITHLYNSVPPLEAMELIDMHINRDGPKLIFKMNFPRFADHRPARWNKTDNTVHVELEFWTISKFEINGFTTTPILNFSTDKIDQQIVVRAEGKDIRICFYCDMIYIQKISGYINTERPHIRHD